MRLKIDIVDVTYITASLLLLLTVVYDQAYAQEYMPFWEFSPIQEEEPPLIITEYVAGPKISAGLDIKYHTSDLSCDSGPKEDIKHSITYTDSKNNTIDIYCQWNPWIPEGTRQFIAFYNNMIIVGLCPYDEAINRHQVETNAEGEIIKTHWLSVRTDGTDYVTYNNYFG